MAYVKKVINGTEYEFESAAFPLGWVFVSYWEGNSKLRVLESDFRCPARLRGREDVEVNLHKVVLFHDRRLAEHFITTMGDQEPTK